jgi:hypothetical protein
MIVFAKGARVSGETLPPSSGLYTLSVTATDDAGNSGTEEVIFVVYDPSAGFVTGGGWIFPDGESTLPDGKATFGFVSKYKNNIATGTLEFQYNDADINLKSNSIDWLAISGASARAHGVSFLSSVCFDINQFS